MSDTLGRMPGPWNANIHYDARLDACVPATAGSVLDVGCGDGFLAARLAERFPQVLAIDVDAPVLHRAQARFPDAPVQWCHGDVMTHPFEPESFGAVVSNATLHHLPDTAKALERLRQLLRPGGTLALVCFVRKTGRDLPWAAASLLALGVANRLRRKWEHTAPQLWPPPETLRSLRRTVSAELPGARVSPLLYGRTLVVWRAPG